MELNRFSDLLDEATSSAIEFARGYVTNHLPEEAVYQLLPNQSHDGSPLGDGEEIFPEDSLEGIDDFHEMNAAEVVEFLWRNGKVPEWINIAVVGVEGSRSVCELRCCGRFVPGPEGLYYDSNSGGRSPFGVKGPTFPSDYIFHAANPKKFELWDPKVTRGQRR